MDEIFKPSLAATLPDGWFAKESVTLLAPHGRANVIGSSEPLSSSIDAYEYAEAQGDLLRGDFQGYDEQEFAPRLVFGGRPGYRRVFSWQPPDGDAVTQVQLYYAEAGRGYTATATTTSREYPEYALQLHACLDGLVLPERP